MQKTLSESSLAGWSLFVLGIVLIGVYTISFSLPQNNIATAVTRPTDLELTHSEQTGSIVPVQITQRSSIDTSDRNEQNPVMQVQNNKARQHIAPQGAQDTQVLTPTYIVSSRKLFDPNTEELTISSKSLPMKNVQILYLAGTHHREGVMKSAKYIGIDKEIQYILKNNDNTHFAYLGKQLPEIADRFSALGGKSIAFTEENDIHTHGLFGDKIILLLVPVYIGKKQLFLVYFAEARDRWFIQVDTDIFETTKPLLRELFAKWYVR